MRQKVARNGVLSTAIKGSLSTLIIMLASVLIFAIIVKFAYFNSGIVKTVNQFIKVISVFLGCFLSVRENKGLIKGLLIGLISCLLISLIFALLGGGIGFGLNFIIDVVFMSLIGLISGIIVVNVKK